MSESLGVRVSAVPVCLTGVGCVKGLCEWQHGSPSPLPRRSYNLDSEEDPLGSAPARAVGTW